LVDKYFKENINKDVKNIDNMAIEFPVLRKRIKTMEINSVN
jgi:hypothetical protein